MGKEFRNIDDLYRSELGGTVTEAPGFVKGNIDSSLGFRKRKAGFLLLGLIALLTTVGITTVVLTNMNGSNQVAQSDISGSETNESTINITSSLNNPTNGAALQNETENRTDRANDENGVNDANTDVTEGISDAVNNSTANDNSNNLNAGNTNLIGNNRTSGTNTVANTRRGDLTAASSNGFSLNSSGPNSALNGTGSNNQTGSVNNSAVGDNGASDGTTNANSNTGSNNTSQGDTNDAKNTGDNGTNNTGDQTNTSNGDNDIPSNSTDPANNDPDANAIADTPDSDVDNTEIDTTSTETDTTGITLPVPVQNPVVINPPPKDSIKPLMISLTSGINLVRSSYTSNDMNEENIYDNGFSDKIGNQTNLDITYRLKNGLTFGTGLGFNNFTESYEFTTYETFLDTTEIFETVINEYEYEYSFYYSVDTATGSVVDSIEFISDSTATPVDTVYTYAYKESQKGTTHNGLNKATYITLPIHLGTQIMMKKFQLDLYASARFNFLTRSSGAYIGENNLLVFGKENSIYKSFYVDVLFASKIHYNFYKNLYLTGTAQYRPAMGNSLKEVSFKKSLDYMHFGLGLSIRL
ncbi:MAG: hypothetical protein ACI8ZM_004969 [Crocinitomix sp.]|jgi:hypothetical protein